MSNEEKKRREQYRKKRKKWIKIQSIIVLVLSVLSIISFSVYHQMNKTVYINYTEVGDIDYKVYLKDNEFYEEEYLGKDYPSFVATLIDSLEIDFNYKLDMESDEVEYNYSYDITAKIEVIDKDSEVSLFNPTYELKPSQTYTQSSKNDLTISEKVTLDYDEYNNLASKFIDTYDLTNTISNLIITTNIKVISNCDDFEKAKINGYTLSLYVPLTNKVANIEMRSSIPVEETKILACENYNNSEFFKNTTIVFGSFDLLFIIVLIGFIYLTRNKDINYALKVQRLVNSYKSYIQKINNGFDMSGYQVLLIDTFNELLEIHDTIQKPILMNENDDKTCTQFIIPSETKILYLFEIKVDDYDELYKNVQEEVTPIEEVVEEVVEEEKEQPVEEKEEEIFIEEDIEIDEEIKAEEDPLARFNYSFESKLILSNYQTKLYYEKIITYVKSYGVKVSRSWKKERVYLGRNPYAVLFFRGKKLCVAMPLDPKEYEGSKYRFEDISDKKMYQKIPFMMKLTSDRKLKHTLELLNKIFKEAGLEDKNLPVNFKKIPYKTRYTLYKDGLIKANEEGVKLLLSEELSNKNKDDLFEARYNYSFESKLILSDYQVKLYYENIITLLQKYGVKIVRSWKKERVYLGRKIFANLVFRGKKLCVAMPLDPKEYEGSKYRFIDVSTVKRFEDTPFMMKLTSDRKLKHTLELLEKVLQTAGLENKDLPVSFKKIPYQSKNSLINKGLIKENIKEKQTV